MLAMETIRTFSKDLTSARCPTSVPFKARLAVVCRAQVRAIAAQTPVYGGRGQPRKPRPAPLYTVKELIEALPASAWQAISWREGTKGTMQVQAVAIRVHWATGSALHSTSHSRVHTGPEGWLLAERPVPAAVADDPQSTPAEPQEKEKEKIKYWFSVLPPETSLQRLVLLAHARWVIEQFYEDAKQECGFDHYQGRHWDGLHRHLALAMLAYSFLMLYRLTLPLPSDEVFPPLRHAKIAAWRASAGAALAVPGSRPLAAPHPAGRVLPPQKKLTK